MSKLLYLTILIFFTSLSFGQQVYDTCNNIGLKISSDSNLNIWTYPNLSLADYYCLGSYFAKKDIENESLIIQTYGNPEHQSICNLCNYKNLGIIFVYHFDIIYPEKTEFINGYNEISKKHIKKLFGDNIFDSLNSLDSSKVNPFDIYSTIMDYNYIKVNPINDTLINVKIQLDSIAHKLNIDFSNTNVDVIDKVYNTQTQNFTYNEIINKGVILRERKNNKYYLTINFDFKNNKSVCFCQYANNFIGSYTIPITVK